jgi:hypothetical protein
MGTYKGVPSLIVYRMRFMGLSTKDRLLDIVCTPTVLGNLTMFLEPQGMADPNFSPMKALTTYLAKATSLREARTLCQELNTQLSKPLPPRRDQN